MVPDTDFINDVIEKKCPSIKVLDTSKEDKTSICSLKEKISRTAQFLQDLKLLSQDCQDLDEDQDDKNKQKISRRIGNYAFSKVPSTNYLTRDRETD